MKKFFEGFPPHGAPDGDPLGDDRLALGLLPRATRRRGRSTSTSSACSPRPRRSRPSPTRSRSASRSSIRATTSPTLENFLHMMFAVPAEPYEVDPVVRQRAQPAADPARRPRAELLAPPPCAWSAARGANLFASISAGICALWGPLHGGANQAVIEMLETHPARRRRTTRSTSTWRRTRTSDFKLMGFGHRVYKNFDPRARILKKAADEVLDAARRRRSAARHRQAARGGRARGRLLRRAQALPERRLLQRHHLPRDGHPDRHVHGDVRARPPARLDRPLEGDARRSRARASTARARSTSARPSAPGCRSTSASLRCGACGASSRCARGAAAGTSRAASRRRASDPSGAAARDARSGSRSTAGRSRR